MVSVVDIFQRLGDVSGVVDVVSGDHDTGGGGREFLVSPNFVTVRVPLVAYLLAIPIIPKIILVTKDFLEISN